ncbi:MAG: hypothetical protein JWQ53_1069, partial [Klenkia sp.]|nr:hypothetical protein [Klenkia sp.]
MTLLVLVLLGLTALWGGVLVLQPGGRSRAPARTARGRRTWTGAVGLLGLLAV